VKVPEIFQVETSHAPEGLASVLHAIAEAGLVVEHVSTVRRDQDRTLWEITIDIEESAHADLLGRLNALPSARTVGDGGKPIHQQEEAACKKDPGHPMEDRQRVGVLPPVVQKRRQRSRTFGHVTSLVCWATRGGAQDQSLSWFPAAPALDPGRSLT
jgi:hypothetical protein